MDINHRVNLKQALEHGLELLEGELAGCVAQGLRRAGVGFQKVAVDAGGHGRAGQGFELLADASVGVG
jgi:hypothetical protein